MLTDPTIRNLGANGSPYRVRDKNTKGFGVQVSAKGAKSFFVAYTYGTERRFYTLGSVAEITLKQARLDAQAIIAKVRGGVDPHQARDEKIASTLKAKREHSEKATLAELFQDYVTTLTLAKKRSAGEVRYLLDVAEKALGAKRKAADIVTTDVSEFIKAKAKEAGTMANRLHQSIRAAFQFGIDSDETSHTKRYALPGNPAVFKKQFEEKARDRCLTAEQLRLLWNSLPTAGFSAQIQAVIMLLLACAGCRIKEAVNARWDEFDFSPRNDIQGWHGAWRIPAGRTKNDKGNIFPLTETAATVVQSMRDATNASVALGTRQSSGFVFASPNDAAAALAWRSVNQALRRWSIRHGIPDFQARDLRRTCKTMLADYLEADEGLMARLHGHAMTRVDQKVYNQAKYMRPKFMLLQRWVHWLNESPAQSNVKPIRKRA
jgi:integrase